MLPSTCETKLSSKPKSAAVVQLMVGISLSTFGVWRGLERAELGQRHLHVEDAQRDARFLRGGGVGGGGPETGGEDECQRTQDGMVESA